MTITHFAPEHFINSVLLQAGEEELWYTTVKFTQEPKDSGHVTKCDSKSEYATVVINTPDHGTPQLDRVTNVEELRDYVAD